MLAKTLINKTVSMRFWEREELSKSKEKEKRNDRPRDKDDEEHKALEQQKVEEQRLKNEQEEKQKAEEAEKLRLETEIKEKQKAEEAEKLRLETEIKEKAETERQEKQKAEEAEKLRFETEKLEKEKAEELRLEAERLGKQKAEELRLETERQEKQKAEELRLEAERQENEKAEDAEKLRLETERQEKQKAEELRLEAERQEKQKAEELRFETEKLEKEKAEELRLETERQEKQKAEEQKSEEQRSMKEQEEKKKNEEQKFKAERQKAEKQTEKAEEQKAEKQIEKAEEQETERQANNKEQETDKQAGSKEDKDKNKEQETDKQAGSKEDKEKNKEQDDNRDDKKHEKYGFTESKADKTVKTKSGFIRSVVRLVASPPIIISTFSYSHILRDLSLWHVIIAVVIASLHYLLVFYNIDRLMQDSNPMSESYGSLDADSPVLGILVDSFVIFLKFITCLFFINLLFEVFYDFLGTSIYMIESVYWRYSIMIATTLVISMFYALYRSFDIFEDIVDFSLVIISFSFLILLCNSRRIRNIQNTYVQTYNTWTSLLFLIFSFLSFSYEVTSCSVFIYNNSKTGIFSVAVTGLGILCVFCVAFFYYSMWLWEMNIKNIVMTLSSDHSILYFIHFSLYSIFGFLLNFNTLNNSVAFILDRISCFNTVTGTTTVLITLFFIIFLVVFSEIGRFLWWSTLIAFLGIPLYSMFTHFLVIKERGFDILSIICVSILAGLFFCSAYNYKILNPQYFPS